MKKITIILSTICLLVGGSIGCIVTRFYFQTEIGKLQQENIVNQATIKQKNMECNSRIEKIHSRAIHMHGEYQPGEYRLEYSTFGPAITTPKNF